MKLSYAWASSAEHLVLSEDRLTEETPARSVWIDLAALFTCSVIAAIPYGIMIAAEDGLPGNTERIIANSVAAGLGLTVAGGLLLLWKRKSSKRLLYALGLVVVMALLAFGQTLRRAGVY